MADKPLVLHSGARCVPGRMRCVQKGAGVAVSTYFAKPNGGPWRSVIIEMRVCDERLDWQQYEVNGTQTERGKQVDERNTLMRAHLRHIAEMLGLDPKTRTRLNWQRRYFIGRVWIYRGMTPTPEEKKLFKRALKLAACIPGAKVELDEGIKKEIG